MARLVATLRIALGLTFLTVSLVLAARSFGFVPDSRRAIVEGRRKQCETLAINCAIFAQQGGQEQIRAVLEASARRDPDILSAAVRREDGSLWAEFGDHVPHWQLTAADQSDSANMFVPIAANGRPWGKVEIRFRPLARSGFWGLLDDPVLPLIGFVLVAGLVVYGLYLQRMLQHLDPSRVIPSRVRAALDTFAEGLLVLDKHERIVLANKAFAETVGCSARELQGRRASDLKWSPGDEQSEQTHPWTAAIERGTPQTGTVLRLQTGGAKERRFRVNSTPIEGDDGVYRGALTSFDDVTEMEEKSEKLHEMLGSLQRSRDEITRQNQELHRLATRDPLTGCLNRRSFFGEFQARWDRATAGQTDLCCIMLDIDYFKSINDRHGHDVGDAVLVELARTLHAQQRRGDLVCRYGGEEFAFLLPDTSLDTAYDLAEQIRTAVEEVCVSVADLSVTASLGVSSNRLGAPSPQDSLKQADECLYAAKRTGRNRVVRYDCLPELADTGVEEPLPVEQTEAATAIPFHAVAVLMSALNYRDSATAEHSRRVADLCVATASGLMSLSDAYILEIAALLHDMGKIGVPDSILLKPGPLTEEEWRVMAVHDRIGVDIVRSFASERLTEIVENHHAWYGGRPGFETGLTGQQIPLGARILCVCDAYDAIVSDRVYRPGRNREAAIAELRRCAGTQFDPVLVEVFISALLAGDGSRSRSMSPVSPQAALRIGTEMERLAAAVDRADLPSLATLAARLRKTAETNGISPIAEAAELLQDQLQEDRQLIEIVRATHDLLDLCRATHEAYLGSDAATDVSAAAFRRKPLPTARDCEVATQAG